MSNHWKTVLLAIGLALASSAPSRAQVTDSSDGLYAPPDANHAEDGQGDTTAARAAESFMQSLDPEVEQLKKRVDSALAAKKAAAASHNDSLLSDADRRWIPWTLSMSESAVVVLLAAMGLGASLLAAGYVWRNRTVAGPVAPVLLDVLREDPASGSFQNEDQQLAPRRRAA